MFKIVACAVACALILIYLKSVNSEFFSVALLGAGVIVISLGVEYIAETVDFVRKLIDASGINAKYFAVLLKITGIECHTFHGKAFDIVQEVTGKEPDLCEKNLMLQCFYKLIVYPTSVTLNYVLLCIHFYSTIQKISQEPLTAKYI